jgi:hypothetical protein
MIICESDLAPGPTPLRGVRIHPGANSNRDMSEAGLAIGVMTI